MGCFFFLNNCAHSPDVPLFASHSDRHQVSSSIPVPTKSKLGAPASEMGYSSRTSSPGRGLRKRASSEAEAQLQYKPNPYPTCTGEEESPAGLAPQSPAPKHLSTSLDARMASLSLTTTMEATKEREQRQEREEGRDTAAEEKCKITDKEPETDEDVAEKQPGSGAAAAAAAANASTAQDFGGETLPTVQHTGAMNGSLVTGQAPISLIPEMCCSVEQAEEIMGTEATGLGLGLGMGLGLGLAGEARLEDYRCIPVDHAVAVECDEQVLGELDAAGFEEFSRRIYALNENMSSFRRPRKNSDK